MLKMGQMCHCGPHTLWKLDPSTGDILWKKDRGADSSAIAFYDAGGGVLYIYEMGLNATSHGRVTGWLSSSGASPSREWDYADAGISVSGDIETDATDFAPWFAYTKGSGQRLARLNPTTGALLNESSGLGVGRTSNAVLYKAPGTSMNRWDRGGSFLTQYDSAFGTVASVSILGAGANRVRPINSDPSGSGFIARTGTIFSSVISHLDENLGSVATSSTIYEPLDASLTKYLGITGGTSLVLRTISGFSIDWSVTAAGTVGMGNLDSSHNAYVVEGSAATRRKAADGTVEWTNADITIASAIKTAIDSDRFYVIGSLNESGEQRQVAAFDLATGNLEWAVKLGATSVDLPRDIEILGGAIYVCGDRMQP